MSRTARRNSVIAALAVFPAVLAGGVLSGGLLAQGSAAVVRYA